MCGFVAGLFQQSADPHLLAESVASLHHRGPDARGQWISGDGRWAMGHARLSIIGLNNGAQPMTDASGNVRLVVNGEFYGYQEIRQQLRAQGYRFVTDSDSEIALHLYLREGSGAFQHLRGEFAGVIADRRNRVMIAFRDRFGVKPLFYTIHKGNVLFASEIKALLALGVPARWDDESMFQESYHFRSHEHTLFKGIHTVPGGHYAVARDGNVSVYPYWDTAYPTAAALNCDKRSEEEIVAGFREVLDDAVKERLIADVEVASYLSGGIDSCGVLGLAQQQMSKPIRAYTLTFDDELYDESHLAKQQAAFVGATYHPVPVTEQQLADEYRDSVRAAETTFINAHGVAKYMLSKAVRDAGIKVVFTGEGADEILGGYPPFRRDVLLYNSEQQDPVIMQQLLADMRESNKATGDLMTHDAAPPAELASVQRRLGWVPSAILSFAQMGISTRKLFRRDFLDRVAGIDPFESSLNRLPIHERVAGRDPLNQSLYIWSKVVLPNYVLTLLGDRMEMAHSIEGRVPFLDHRVAEYAAKIPINMKIRGMREKHVLREAIRDVVIEPVYNREKHPFTTPPSKSAHAPMWRLFEEVMHSEALDNQPVFDPKAARALLDELSSAPPENRFSLEIQIHRVISTSMLNEAFKMSA